MKFGEMFKPTKRECAMLGAVENGILPGPGSVTIDSPTRLAMFQMSECVERVLEKFRVLVP